jgi:DNA-directed RNA polymerase sigma subunit (sigma70/sigma32)
MRGNSLSRVARAAERAKREEHALRAAREELRHAILAARDAGESLAAIGRTLGVTRQRVKQIISE